jgi:hypothetical protein
LLLGSLELLVVVYVSTQFLEVDIDYFFVLAPLRSELLQLPMYHFFYKAYINAVFIELNLESIDLFCKLQIGYS